MARRNASSLLGNFLFEEPSIVMTHAAHQPKAKELPAVVTILCTTPASKRWTALGGQRFDHNLLNDKLNAAAIGGNPLCIGSIEEARCTIGPTVRS